MFTTLIWETLGEGHEAFDKTFQLLVNLNKFEIESKKKDFTDYYERN